jgi:hypothetical protein
MGLRSFALFGLTQNRIQNQANIDRKGALRPAFLASPNAANSLLIFTFHSQLDIEGPGANPDEIYLPTVAIPNLSSFPVRVISCEGPCEHWCGRRAAVPQPDVSATKCHKRLFPPHHHTITIQNCHVPPPHLPRYQVTIPTPQCGVDHDSDNTGRLICSRFHQLDKVSS